MIFYGCLYLILHAASVSAFYGGKWFGNPFSSAPVEPAIPSTVSLQDLGNALNSLADSLYDWQCVNLGYCSSTSNLQSRLEKLRGNSPVEEKRLFAEEFARPKYDQWIKTIKDFKDSGSGTPGDYNIMQIISKVVSAYNQALTREPAKYDEMIGLLIEAYDVYFMDYSGVSSNARSKGSPGNMLPPLNYGGMNRSSSSSSRYSFSSRKSSFS